MKKSDVSYLAKLSNLSIAKDESAHIARDLSKTLEAIDTLSKIDTSRVEPTFQTSGNKNRFQNEHTGERCLTITIPFSVTTHYLKP